MSKGTNVSLRLAGMITDENYGKSVKKYITEHNMEAHVCLLGNININQIKNELKMASIFALLSLEENSPMGIEEAMAAGVPVVTSNLCGMPYMISHSESGFLVDPSNLDDIVSRLSQILEDYNLQRAMANKSKEIAKARFHPDLIAKKTVGVYSDCIKYQRITNR